jgi:hypothetical protein
MTPRLRVGDRAICVTEDRWNGRVVLVQEVRNVEPIYTVSDGWDDVDLASDELAPMTPPRTPSPVAAWFRANVLWLLATLAVGVVAALVIAVLGSEGAL